MVSHSYRRVDDVTLYRSVDDVMHNTRWTRSEHSLGSGGGEVRVGGMRGKMMNSPPMPPPPNTQTWGCGFQWSDTGLCKLM